MTNQESSATSPPDAGVTDDRCVKQRGAVNQTCLTPEQLTALRERLAQNRQPVFRGEQYALPRGWNDAFDFVEKTIKEVMEGNHDGSS